MRKYTKYIIATVILGALGFGASLYLIPEDRTLEQMRVRDDQLRAGSFIDFGARYLAGERSTDIVVGYADQLVAQNRGEEALTVVSDYVTVTPSDAVVRRKQAEILQFLGRTEEYVATLEWLAENANDEDSLRLLSDYYNGTGDFAAQETTLRRLLELTEGNDPRVYVDLATIQNTLGDRAATSETLGQLAERYPDYLDFPTLRLYVLALLDQGDIARAEQYAQRWLSGTFEPNEAADLANILHYNASARSALTLLNPYQNVINSDATLLLAYVNALRSVGEGRDAYELLRQRAELGPISGELLPAYIPLALEYGNEEEVLAAIDAIDKDGFDEPNAVELVRLAKEQDNDEVVTRVIAKFNDAEYMTNKPVLRAIIALHHREENADIAIAEAIASPINSDLRIALANACVEARKNKCVEDILASLPPVERMTPGVVASTADLYLALKRGKAIYPDVTTYRQQNPSTLMDQTWLRLVAATGDKAAMEAWLAANADNATQSTLRDFYYTANNNGHRQTALVIAEHLYKRSETAENRNILVAAYLRSFQYGKALPFLRENKNTSARAEGDYVTALERLSKNSSSARKELVSFAKSKLNRGGLSQSEQRRYVFLLLNNGERNYARSIIESNASRFGGQWATMLAQLNGVGGTPADTIRSLSADERVAYASQGDVSRERQREVAFGLIEDGYEEHAVSIFNGLASVQPAGSEDVNDLLFLLEKRNPQQALSWMDARRRNATTQSERLEWSNLIADKSDPFAFMGLVSSDPSLLSEPRLRNRYFNALGQYGSREEYTNAMRPWVNATSDIDGLIEYAQIAEGKGYRQAAINAYKRATAVDGGNLLALRSLGANAFQRADYSEATKYLDRYFALRQQTGSNDNAYLASFYKAEMLRRDGQKDAANRFFEQSFQGARSLSGQDVGSQSIMYSSLFHLGRTNEAVQGFRNLLERNPRNRTLLADYMSVLIEYKYYEEAQRVANQYDYSPRLQAPAQAAGIPVSSADHAEQGQLYYRVTLAQAQVSDAVYRPTDETLRLQLLYARIEVENGDRDAALNRLRIVEQYYGGNPELLGYIASIESAGGNFNKALQLLDQASSLSPDNEDIFSLRRNVKKIHGNFVKLDQDWRRIGNSDERITTLSGKHGLNANSAFGYALQYNDIDTSQVRRSNTGIIADDDYQKSRGQIYYDYYRDNGDRTQASLFGNDAGVGVGFAYAFNNSLGRSDLILDYNRPYWDFVEAVVEDATRDRIGLTHSAQISDTISFFGETSLNRYNIQGEENAASSYLLRASFVKRIRERQPYIGIGYGFDGEYLIDQVDATDPSGVRFNRFPLNAREIHFFSAIFQHEFTRTTTGDLVVGYAIDRLGQNGPAVEARLTEELTDSLEAQARFRFGVETNDTDANTTTAGGHLLWRY